MYVYLYMYLCLSVYKIHLFIVWWSVSGSLGYPMSEVKWRVGAILQQYVCIFVTFRKGFQFSIEV